MTLFYFNIIFLTIFLIVIHDYIPLIVRLPLCLSIELYSAHLDIRWVSGKHSVSMVLIPCFPAIAPYILGHVVDRGGDSTIESFIVQTLCVGVVELYCSGRCLLYSYAILAMFTMIKCLSPFSND
jgi:hypothetical protein